MSFPVNSKVIHPTHGKGFVVSDQGKTVVVRFSGSNVAICAADSLELQPDCLDLLRANIFSSLLETIAHIQAMTICSINDKWGVFGRSLIDLLPHQLWVCRQARSKRPCRLLVADDVGLGKTIEAGIILSAFLGSGEMKRILVLTPSSLVDQWQERMQKMFDVRLTKYIAEADTPRIQFWSMYDSVVASFHTLRMENNGRLQRLLEAEPWDLVIVDEAHHFNRDERTGATLTYNLLKKMEDHQRIRSMIFFTGTPHKGKNYSFLALMQLLSPKFIPNHDLHDQLPQLKDFMIRNNKYNVTDLHGNLLFKEPLILPEKYRYTDQEQSFYDMLTEFIMQGLAYAREQSQSRGNVMMLVLIGMQKLASSSIAAIRHALLKRYQKLAGITEKSKEIDHLLKELNDAVDDDSRDDERAAQEEQLLENAESITLIKDELPALKKLLDAASAISNETKIDTIMNVVHEKYATQQILFFTEYKSTQRKLMECLLQKYGKDSVTIINGDEYLDDVKMPDGSHRRVTIRRSSAAEKFNNGDCRFLIATEAAGEGIDLQKNCHVLFHVDLPWNPMRLQQRVGRLNRYGQKEKVIVQYFRNPDTVESRIWDKLNEKLSNIDQTFGAVMEQKEDMFQLVLGMTPPKMFDELFSGAPQHADEDSLSKWFDKKTAHFGGKDVVDVVSSLVGNSAKFNYHQVSELLPKVDLPDLQSFLGNILLSMHKRMIVENGEISFSTPSEWQNDFGIFDRYENLILSRNPERRQTVLGIGIKIFDKALQTAIAYKTIVSCADIDYVLAIFSVQELLTDQGGEKQASIYGCSYKPTQAGNHFDILPDWKLLKILNTIKPDGQFGPSSQYDYADRLNTLMPEIKASITDFMQNEVFIPQQPVISLECVIVPAKNNLAPIP